MIALLAAIIDICRGDCLQIYQVIKNYLIHVVAETAKIKSHRRTARSVLKTLIFKLALILIIINNEKSHITQELLF